MKGFSMEALYQLFIFAGQLIAVISLICAGFAFYFSWVIVDDDRFKYIGWTFLILAGGAGLLAGAFYLLTICPDIQDWVGIALPIVPVVLMGIAFAVLYHRKRKWEKWLLFDDEMSTEG